MFGLSLPRAKAPKTPSAPVTGQNEPRRKHSSVAKTFKKLKQVVSFSRSVKRVSPKNESSSHHKDTTGCHLPPISKPTVAADKPLPTIPLAPRPPTTETSPRHLSKTQNHAASSLPIPKRAFPISATSALVSNPSELDRYLAQYPRPKIVYTPAEARAVVEAFVSNAKYEEDLARNTHCSRKVPKPRQERPPSWDRSFEARMASSRYSATSEDIRRMQEEPMYKAWQDVTGQVGSSSSKPETAPSEPCSITIEEMEKIIQDPTKLDAVWNRTSVGSGSRDYESAATPERIPITIDDLKAVAQGPVDIDWEGASQFESWYWELQNMRPWTWSFIAEEMEQPDVERQEDARIQAYLKLVKKNLCDEYPKVF